MMRTRPYLILSLAVAGAMATLSANLSVAQHDADRFILVRFDQPTPPGRAQDQLDSSRFKIDSLLVPELDLYKVEIVGRMRVDQALHTLKRNPSVRYAQADHPVSLREDLSAALLTPDDLEFSKQWSLHNEGSAHVHATRAWEQGTGGKDARGNDLVVAIVDGGMDLMQSDLRDNLWTNPGEIPGNGVDDDQNGYVDDVHGWNPRSGSGQIPNNTHGTHVAGIVGAKGNNGMMITGVNWSVKLMAVPGASGTTSVVAAAYGYVLRQKKLWLQTSGAKGANVVATNSSFGVDRADCQSSEYPVWNDLYDELGKAGILSAAATANVHLDVDVEGDVPTGCKSEYLVSVTNTDSRDQKHAYAAYGATSVDLGAPGTQIWSTVPGNRVSPMSGTSMATPHVAGAIALLHSVAPLAFVERHLSAPGSSALELKRALLETTDPLESLKGITVSGGRLNLKRAVDKMTAE